MLRNFPTRELLDPANTLIVVRGIMSAETKTRQFDIKKFIERSKKKHGNKYDYSKSIYLGSTKKIEIICSAHGTFWQLASGHMRGKGCKECYLKNKKMTTKGFIRRSKEMHRNKYIYTKSKYSNSSKDVIIICPQHGEFKQRASSHLNGSGCKKCYYDSLRKDANTFINESKQIHGNKYDYSKVDYIDRITKVKIICPEHGEFNQKPHSHLEGHGCHQCHIDNITYTKEDFVKAARKTHGDKYDYSKVIYAGSFIKVEIICPDHGSFWQEPGTHTHRDRCPSCKESRGEASIAKWLDKRGVQYERQKTFDECININKLKFDFYLPNHNLCIEYDGRQHFKPVDYLGGKKRFEYTKKNDLIKNKFCKDANIRLLRIGYFDFKRIGEILKDNLHE